MSGRSRRACATVARQRLASLVENHEEDDDNENEVDGGQNQEEEDNGSAFDENEEREEDNDDDDDYEDEQTTKKRKKTSSARSRPTKKKKKLETSEEIEAGQEIDRLLQQAHQDYCRLREDHYGLPAAKVFGRYDSDSEESLAAAKKKIGKVALLKLLCTKLCEGEGCGGRRWSFSKQDEKKSPRRLGMFFFRERGGFRQYSADHVEKSICCHCVLTNPKDEDHVQEGRGGDWTHGQAQKGLKIGNLAYWLQRGRDATGGYHSPVRESPSDGVTKLYSPWTVTLTALSPDKCNETIWGIHHQLALKEKRRRH